MRALPTSIARIAFVLSLFAACTAQSSSSRSAHDTPQSAEAKPGETARTADTSVRGPAWLASSHPNLRKLTVVVKSAPPEELAAEYRELAARYKPLAPLFLAFAGESFGSGFLMVRREVIQSAAHETKLRAFVVTNRHVVGLASEVSVSFEASGAPVTATVAYVDDLYDLAVLSLDPSQNGGGPSSGLLLEGGLAIESTPAKDQDAVVASGYPAIAGKPSYQVTRGYVSNERFLLSDWGEERLYLQHTAPIDPGSSGGPLTTGDGKLLGVNTFKVSNRENVGLAVPAAIVERALDKVAGVAEQPANLEAGARTACEEITQRIMHTGKGSAVLERSIGARLVAEQGLVSLGALPEDGTDWHLRFIDDPTEVFLHAIAARLQSEALTGKAGAGSIPACAPTPSSPSDRTVAFKVGSGRPEQVLRFGFEQARWKLVAGAVSPRSKASFMDELNSPGRRKKWKPSLK